MVVFGLELPELAGLGVVLATMIVLYGLATLAMVITLLFKAVPYVGGWIGDHVTGQVASALASAAGWVGSGIGPLTNLMWTPIKWLATLLKDGGEALLRLEGGVVTLYTQTIPRLLGGQAAFTTQLYHQALSYADQDAAAVTSTAHSLFTQAEADIGVAEGAIAGFATTLYHQALAYTDQTAGKLAAFSTQLYDQSIAYVDQEAGKLANFATTLYHQAIGYVDQQTGRITDWVGQQVGSLGAEVAGVAGVITATVLPAITAVETRVGAIETAIADVEECVGPICEAKAAPQLSTLANLLNELAPLVEGGLLFALLAEAVRDPRAVAGDIETVVGDTVRTAATGFRDLVGIAAAA